MQDDMAKIGWLYLNNGRWGQKQIVPGPWVEASTSGHIKANPGDQYGYHWWVKNDGNYSAVGYKGQFIFVEREKNMVVVFTRRHIFYSHGIRAKIYHSGRTSFRY